MKTWKSFSFEPTISARIIIETLFRKPIYMYVYVYVLFISSHFLVHTCRLLSIIKLVNYGVENFRNISFVHSFLFVLYFENLVSIFSQEIRRMHECALEKNAMEPFISIYKMHSSNKSGVYGDCECTTK